MQRRAKRGDEVLTVSISVPVGPETLGRIINVVGDSIDEKGEEQKKNAYTDLLQNLLTTTKQNN